MGNPALPETSESAEIQKFDRLAPQWWDSRGPMRVLHRMNEVRVGWVAARAGAGAIRLVDVGCGAGIAAEAFARLGYDVLGVDASAEAITAGRRHAAAEAVPVTYRVGVAADLLAENATAEAVTALEVIEHVEDQPGFLAELAGLTVPGGRVFVSTLNRTLRSLAFAKIGAEYVARLLPAGTHDWQRFVPPEALAAYGRAAGLRLIDISGMAMNPLTGDWSLTRNLAVNYIAAFEKPAASGA
jgi:2-polyprenyl-6-hydroxyphenyl methylase/3-demethylubiquinone-9 3-methyltransferase